MWVVLLSVVGGIVWLVRLESLVKYNKEQTQTLRDDFEDQRSRDETVTAKIMEQLSKVRESLARLEGAIGVKDSRQGE